jgi:aminoglycoside phosphotransferase (APT) family kinase protein
MNGLPGIDRPSVEAWFTAHVADAAAPLHFDLIAGGHSNLTYRVSDASGPRWVLRRPPTGELLKSAHDMTREWRLITALRGHVPVPPAVAMCSDETVTGSPFHVTEFVDGTVLRNAEQTAAVTDPAERVAMSRAFAQTLAQLHTVDAAQVGLSHLGRGAGYLDRQLHRWRHQYEASRSREVPGVAWTFDRLLACKPRDERVTLVHADYRLDNVIFAPDGVVRAVLDWELATLGDPLADVGSMVAFWTSEGEPSGMDYSWATSAGGFVSRDELVEHYASCGNIEVNDLDYYIAFAHWRVACIGEGVFARYRSGRMTDVSAETVQMYADSTVFHAGRATQIASQLRPPCR